MLICFSICYKIDYSHTQNAELKKCNKHLCACKLMGYGFKAFATDTCGIISPSSNLLLCRIASAYALLSNPPYSYALNICKRRIIFAIQKGLVIRLIYFPSNLPL